MPRRGFIPKREVLDDPMYGGKLVTKLINQVMLDGKRGTAQKACYGAFDIIREKTGRDPVEVFDQCMNNIMPVLEVKARRVGGATYQVPIEIRPERRQTLGLRWLVNAARALGTHDDAAPCRRNHGCLQFDRFCLQEEGRHPQDGRGQQGVRALSLVIKLIFLQILGIITQWGRYLHLPCL